MNDRQTGALFAALKGTRRETEHSFAVVHEQLDDIRRDIKATHAAVDRNTLRLSKTATVIGCTVLGGLIGFTGYEAFSARQQLSATSLELTQLRTAGITPDGRSTLVCRRPLAMIPSGPSD